MTISVVTFTVTGNQCSFKLSRVRCVAEWTWMTSKEHAVTIRVQQLPLAEKI